MPLGAAHNEPVCLSKYLLTLNKEFIPSFDLSLDLVSLRESWQQCFIITLNNIYDMRRASKVWKTELKTSIPSLEWIKIYHIPSC